MIADLRLAARTLSRSSGCATGAISALALGLGAAATVFSVVDAILLRLLPASDRLAVIHSMQPARGVSHGAASFPNPSCRC